ncbi:hypothetical protein ACFV0R_08175 [Streptomyces sp. NPDC059578]|uniref:hypothetical protein n=1 Tax=Streptomyces sp. NPDC059578 TaxID=3346874 RepID=UPI0036B3B8B4
MNTHLSFDDGWRATVTGEPLSVAPRFAGDSLRLVEYADVQERERFAADTFGSGHRLWDTPRCCAARPGTACSSACVIRMSWTSRWTPVSASPAMCRSSSSAGRSSAGA